VYIHAVIHKVVLSKLAQKQLRKVPEHVVLKLAAWVEAVEHDGLEQVRKIPGFHDEPLLGTQERPAIDPAEQGISGNLRDTR
jgi:hypothetical protein